MVMAGCAVVLLLTALAPAAVLAQDSSQPAKKTAPAKDTAKKPAPAATKAAPAKKSTTKPGPAPAPTPSLAGVQPNLLGQYGDWGAYVAGGGDRRVCYALATPGSTHTTPANRPRNQPYLFIATRMPENVKNEVSVIIGYPFKADSPATVDIGANKFTLYTKGDGAWISNAAEEARMVEIMRKGSDLVVSGTSNRGTQSSDRYSLKGLAQALDRAAKECR
jgi:hypothetical protein